MGVKLRSKKLAKGCESFYLDIHHKGQRWPEFLNIHTVPGDPIGNAEKKRLAKHKRNERDKDLTYSSNNVVNPAKFKANFLEYFNNYNTAYKNADRAAFVACLAKLRDFNKIPSLPCSNITPAFVEKFADFLKHNQTLSVGTASDYLKKFKKVIKHAKKDGYFTINPTEDIKIKNPTLDQLTKQWLNADEIQVIANTPFPEDPDLKRMFLLGTQTGMAWSEQRAFKEGHINLKLGIVEFIRPKTKVVYSYDLNQAAIELIGPLTGDPGRIIFNPLHPTTRNPFLKKLIKRAGIKKHITFHCCRHSAVTNLLLAGNNTKQAGLAVGHKTEATTKKYSHITLAAAKNSFSKLPELMLAETRQPQKQLCNPVAFTFPQSTSQ